MRRPLNSYLVRLIPPPPPPPPQYRKREMRGSPPLAPHPICIYHATHSISIGIPPPLLINCVYPQDSTTHIDHVMMDYLCREGPMVGIQFFQMMGFFLKVPSPLVRKQGNRSGQQRIQLYAIMNMLNGCFVKEEFCSGCVYHTSS